MINISRLKEIREDKDYTQNEIADFLKVTQAQYSRYEKGINAIPLENIYKLANFYNTSIDYILYRTDKKEPYPKSIMNK